MNRIVHLTTVHQRHDIRILIKECTALSQAGYDVHLVVGDGEGNEVFEGVPIHDLGVKPNSRIKRMWSQPKKAQEKIIELNPDMVHFHDPELLPLGVKLARRGMRVIYDAHEDVPRQSLVKQYIPLRIRPFVAKLLESYENHAAKKFSGMIAATPHIERRFLMQGINVVNVSNYPILGDVASFSGKKTRKKQVCYIGGISRMRGLGQVIRALPLVPDIQLVLCGGFSEAAFEMELRNEPGWAQVDYRGQVDRVTAEGVMQDSIAGLVTFLPTANHMDAQPNKLFEYMSAKLPVIGSNFPYWKEMIEGAGCGLCVDPTSPKAIAKAIQRMCDSASSVEEMGQAGQQETINKYNWSKESQKLIAFYNALV